MNMGNARRAMLASLDWYVVRVVARKEYTTARLLKAQGFTPFVPSEWQPRRRSSRRQHPKPVEMCRAMLLRYVLIGFEDSPPPFLSVLRFENLVEGFVAINGTPARVHPQDLERLLLKHQFESLVPDPGKIRLRKRAPVSIGNRCEVMSGPLAGQVIRVEKLKGNRADVVPELFNPMRSISIDVDNINPID